MTRSSVRLSAAVGLLFSFLWTLAAIGVFLTPSEEPQYELETRITSSIAIALGLLGIASASGMLWWRRWAYYAFLDLLGLVVIGASFFLLVGALGPRFPGGVMLALGFGAASGMVWWCWLMRSAVRVNFQLKARAGDRVRTLAWINIGAAVLSALLVFDRTPIAFCGIWIDGWWTVPFWLVNAAWSFAIGYGLLRRLEWTRTVGLAGAVYGVVYSVGYLLQPNPGNRLTGAEAPDQLGIAIAGLGALVWSVYFGWFFLRRWPRINGPSQNANLSLSA